ncbi:PKD domain-containing protein [Pseudoalteromonas luteoviolacea]|uniref:PKD/Chitinase domain-containing protein n=1 Tax=Pseudoalteromonas luteoviolacea S4060-1 TaxID=1365257 RepID=A0A167LQZ7_9GAMM|nr:hypothetical protein [Pseudoalteromonas luteoviolacea]KZN65042.1 hypothetical protein N478_03270 [Pseudoalteromonas luteoviolacea S4060-1]
MLVASCGGSSGGDSGNPTTPTPTPTPTQPQNNAPTVSISGENSIQEKKEISLTAQASDSDGSVESYSWQIVSGPSTTLTNSATQTVTFTTPDVTEDTTMTLRVTVTDDDNATASADFNLGVSRIVKSVTITGLVTDGPIPNAGLTIIIGDQNFELAADAEGKYTYTLDVDESMEDDLVRIRAKGGTTQSEVEFYSQLPSFASIQSQAGEDGVLDKDDNFGVNITNVTTSEYALITKEVGIPQSQSVLNQALVGIDADEKLTLAALIKIVVDGEGDDAFDLPPGVNSTFDLVSSQTAVDDLTNTINEQNPSLIDSTKNEIKDDGDLVDSGQTGITGDFLIGSTSRFEDLFLEATFSADNTGTFADYSSGNITWTQNEQGLVSITFVGDVRSNGFPCTDSGGSQLVCQFKYKSATFSVIDENPIAKAISINFIGDEITVVSEGEGTVLRSDVSRPAELSMIDKSNTITPDSGKFSGDWYINALYYVETGKFASKVTFNSDGTGSAQTPSGESRSLSWSIANNTLTITLAATDTLAAKAFTYWMIKGVHTGYQFWATTEKTESESHRRRSGLMIPEQQITLTESDALGRFREHYGSSELRNNFIDNYVNGASYYFLSNLRDAWHVSGRTLDMVNYLDSSSGTSMSVRQCSENATSEQCTLQWHQKIEVISRNNSAWFARVSYPATSQNSSRVVQYLKGQSTLTQFDYFWLDGKFMYFIEDSQVLSNQFTVKTNEDNSTSRVVLTNGNEIGTYSIAQGLLKIDQMGAVGVTKLNMFDRDYLNVCGYPEGTSCDSGEVRNLYFDFALASRALSTTPPTTTPLAIDGTWYMPSSPDFVIVIRDGVWVHMELKSDQDPQGFAGLEIGSLTWNESSGELMVSKVIDTNGVYGFDSNLMHVATVANNQLTLDIQGESPTVLERLIDSNEPRVGGFIEYPLSTDKIFVNVFLPDNKFFEAEYNPAMSDGPGINYGSYVYNADSGLTELTYELNQLNTDDTTFFLYQAGPDVLHWKDTDEVGAVVRVKPNSTQPYLDPYKLKYERFALKNGDMTHYIDMYSNGTADFVTNGQTRAFTWTVTLGQLNLKAVTPSAGLAVEAYVITPTAKIDDGWNVDVIMLSHPTVLDNEDSPDHHTRFSGTLRR